MKRLLFVLLSCSCLFADPVWTWKGFEVLGNHSVSREELIRNIPIQIGTESTIDLEAWQRWCENIKVKFNFYAAYCNTVRYANPRDAYFTLDIVERGEESRAQFRPEPVHTIELATPEILKIYEALQKRMWSLFNAGTPSNEFVTEEYLDYADAQMHAYVLQLTRLVPSYQENLFLVLKHEKDPVKRMKACDLLNWALNTKSTVMNASLLLDDPHSGVRNQLARFMMHFAVNVKSPKDQLELKDRLLLQLNRPSHGDRNKSLANLNPLARTYPGLRPYIKIDGEKLITYIANTSVLFNVAGEAQELLKLLNEK